MPTRNKQTRIAIIGGGPAGMSCALWLAQYGYHTTIFEKNPRLGGALLESNYPNTWVLGQENCDGPTLAARYASHIANANLSLRLKAEISEIISEAKGYSLKIRGIKQPFQANIIALCTGMAVTGSEALAGISGVMLVQRKQAITFGQPSPAQIEYLQGTQAAVIGGGDNAYEAAIALAYNGCSVTLLQRSAKPRAQQKILNMAKALVQKGTLCIRSGVTITTTAVAGDIIKITLSDGTTMQAAHLFALLGYSANTHWLKKQLSGLTLDDKGFVIADNNGRTAITGVYAGGDTVANLYKSVVTAIADGSIIAQSIHHDYGA